jgi:hypothetical protein
MWRAPFARYLVVKAAERDAKRLQRAQRVLVVHREAILAHAPELHNDRLRVLCRVEELEILY